MTQDKKRIEWLDIAKGIAILLVIMGHARAAESTSSSVTIRAIIYSFHMPLFFIASGMVHKPAENLSNFYIQTKKTIKRILLPAILLGLYSIIIKQVFWQGKSIFSFDFIKTASIAIFYSQGAASYYKGIFVESVGVAWFLMALFFAKEIFSFVELFIKNKTFLGAFSVLSALFSYNLLQNGVLLPLTLSIASLIMPFYFIGMMIKAENIERSPGLQAIIWLLVYLISFTLILLNSSKYLELAQYRLPLGFISYIPAIAGSMFIFEISVILSRIKLFNFLKGLGEKSMFIFIIHALEDSFDKYALLTNSHLINGLLRIFVVLGICCYISFLRKRINALQKSRDGQLPMS